MFAMKLTLILLGALLYMVMQAPGSSGSDLV